MTQQMLITILTIMALSGAVPVLTLLLQFSLAGFNTFCSHYDKCAEYFPHVAVIVPSWNEGKVVENSVERLIHMNYPLSSIRVYVVDDGSTDETPQILARKQLEYPGIVFNLRRENGGQGKAHTLNYGLNIVLSDPWAEAILIMDADVAFQKDTLRKMTRHLADPAIGAVTAYIKEGSPKGNILVHFIGFEYVSAQAGARRSQNVLGVQACLAGGAQLHSRINMIDIGGQIDTSTLAEDTFTTFKTQLSGKKVVFDGNALVESEEPDTILGLWKQRFRWARGNLQMTKSFRRLWFRPDKSKLGGIFFDLIWFSITLMPFFMITVSIGLTSLFFIDRELSWKLFQSLGYLSVIAYLFATLYTFCLDPSTAKHSWVAGLVFPGIISLCILAISTFPHYFEYGVQILSERYALCCLREGILLFIDIWVAGCMLLAWLIYRMDLAGFSQRITHFLLLFVGYGALLCAITFCAFVAQVRNVNVRWDKTEKIGKVKPKPKDIASKLPFAQELEKDIRHERYLFIYEIMVTFFVAVVLFLCHYYEL